MTNEEIRFCSYCGTKLDTGARFCKNCGKAVLQQKKDDKDENTNDQGNPSSRQTVYEGYIHKCPNCGEVLESFTATCPACGYEIRDTRTVSSAKELAEKLEAIDEKQMPHFQAKQSILKTLVGKDFRGTDEEDEARSRFERERVEQKANLIINYPIPNTREDMLELMLLASSNINVKDGVDDDLSQAWLAKMEQVCKRAEITLHNSEDYDQIRLIRDRKREEIRKRKIRKVLLLLAGVLGWVIFMYIAYHL